MTIERTLLSPDLDQTIARNCNACKQGPPAIDEDPQQPLGNGPQQAFLRNCGLSGSGGIATCQELMQSCSRCNRGQGVPLSNYLVADEVAS